MPRMPLTKCTVDVLMDIPSVCSGHVTRQVHRGAMTVDRLVVARAPQAHVVSAVRMAHQFLVVAAVPAVLIIAAPVVARLRLVAVRLLLMIAATTRARARLLDILKNAILLLNPLLATRDPVRLCLNRVATPDPHLQDRAALSTKKKRPLQIHNYPSFFFLTERKTNKLPQHFISFFYSYSM